MKRRTLSLIISCLLGVIAILSGIYLMAASVTNYIAESKKTDWIVTEARITDVSSRVKMLMYGKEASNRKQEIDRQHYTIPNQRPKDKHCGKI